MRVAAPAPRAMILAAGRGERMRPLTDSVPKPLLTVAGRTLIEHHLIKLAAAGFADVVINVSWKAEDIVAHIGDGSRFGLQVHWSHEERPLETGGGVSQARAQLGEGWFALVSADVYTDYDFRELRALGESLDQATDARLLLVPHQSALRGEYRLDGERVRMVEAADARADTYTWASLGVFRAQLFDGLPRGEAFPLLPWFRRWMGEDRVGGSVYSGRWENLGTEAQLSRLRGEIGD